MQRYLNGRTIAYAIAGLLALLWFASAMAAPIVIATTPASFVKDVVAAPCPAQINLAAGDYGVVYMRGKTAKVCTGGRLVINGTPGAVFTSLRLDSSAGIEFVNLEVGSMTLLSGTDLFVRGLYAHGGKNGLVFSSVDGGSVIDSEFYEMTSDGVVIQASQNILVQRIVCHGSKPAIGAHPDCVQVYGLEGKRPLNNIMVRDSVAVGPTQGFVMFGNVVQATNVVFDNLTVFGTAPRGISMATNCAPGCALRNSRVERMRGAKYRIQIDPALPLAGWAVGSVANNSVGSTRP